MPFIGCLIALPMLGAVVLAVFGLATWIQTRSFRAARWYFVPVLLPVLYYAGMTAFGGPSWRARGSEENVLYDEAQLLGAWHSKSGSVTLTADGTYTTPEGRGGRWRRAGDFGIRVGRDYWRVLKADGELMLLPTPEGDPDHWDYSLVYARER
jgi:hypothetical protein